MGDPAELVRDFTLAVLRHQARVREDRATAFVLPLPRHEQVRVVCEVRTGVGGQLMERYRVRSWWEVSLTEVTRVLQGLTVHGVPEGGHSQFHGSETFGIDRGNAMGVE